MYCFHSRVRYSEVDRNNHLDLVSLINYLQDCSTFQSEDIGMGLEYLKEKNRVWVLNSWQIIIDRFPSLGEHIEVGTWAYDFKSMYGYRNFVIRDKNSNLCCRANSVWVFMDTQTYKPVKIFPEDVLAYGNHSPLEMEYAPRKIPLVGEFITNDSFPVMASNIDTNQHVNNSQYIKMASDYLPGDFCVNQVRAEYKMSAVLGDIIVPKVSTQNDLCTVILCNLQEHPYAIVEFIQNTETN